MVAEGIPNWLQVMGILSVMSSVGSDLGFLFGVPMVGLSFGLVFQSCFKGGGGSRVVVWLVWIFYAVGSVALVIQFVFGC